MTSPPASKPPAKNVADRVAIVGVGLIGGSIAAALKQRGFAGKIVGVGRDAARLESARSRGLIDEHSTDLAAAAKCELVIVCYPVDMIVDAVCKIAASSRHGTLITDAGSVKGSICEPLTTDLSANATFIGSHPLAGSERQGFEHADANLYEGRVTIVTPHSSTPPNQLVRLKRFWQSLGSAVIEMSPADHDRIVAEISHVPHVAAAALALTLAKSNEQLASTGFRDTTRVASGDPGLWTPILLSNAPQVAECLDHYANRIDEFRKAVAANDAARLNALLTEAKTNRDALARSARN